MKTQPIVLPENCIMTLKDVVDTINIARKEEGNTSILEHGKAKIAIKSLATAPSFGRVENFSTLIRQASNGAMHQIETLALTSKQAIAAAAKLDNNMLMKVINRVEELENKRGNPTDELENAIRVMELTKRGAELFGLKGNQALLSANRATKEITSIDLIKVMDIQLISETKEQILTPTEIGKILDPSLSGIAINKILQALGLQEKVGKHWQPTEKGMEFAELLDTGKKHSDGTPVKQLKWKHSVSRLIED